MKAIESLEIPALENGLAYAPDIPAAEIHCALAHILSSALFAKSQRMTRLLHFLVQKAVMGIVRDTNEYTIGIEVFDRDPASYSTYEDPIVRVQIGRLREKLKAYYASASHPADLIISIPVGTYMPVISRFIGNDGADKTPRKIAILPLQCIMQDSSSICFTQGLNEELSYRMFHDYAYDVAHQPFPGAQNSAPSKPSWQLPSPPLAQVNISHIVEGSIRVYGDQVRASMRLIDAAASCLVWSAHFDRPTKFSIASQEELATAICQQIDAHFCCT